MKKAFTLIEMMISIVILSLIVTYLYSTNSSLSNSNKIITQELSEISSYISLQEILYRDIQEAVTDINITTQQKEQDFVSFRTKHSLHLRVLPYVAYILKNDKLYRVESAEPLIYREISAQDDYDVDIMGDTELFRLYRKKEQKEQTLNSFLLHVIFSHKKELLLKIPARSVSSMR